jgi:EmrB/QacA subfamily drug resistance transporter
LGDSIASPPAANTEGLANSDSAGAQVPPPPYLSGFKAALVILGIFLGLTMGSLDNFVVLTVLPNIVTDLHQPNGVTFVVSSYLIAATIAIPIFGKLSDILSRRNVFLATLGLFIGGSVLSGLSQDLNQLILFRGVQGFGNGGFFPVGIAIVATVFPPEMRARVTGMLSGVFAIGTIAGPFLGSYIVDHTSWRWVFYINIPVGLVGIGVVAASLGALRPLRRGAFDGWGAALLALWVGVLVYPLYQVSNGGWQWGDERVIGMVSAAVALFVVFVLWELRNRSPLVPLRLLGRKVVAANGSIALLRGFAFFSLVTFLSVYVGIVLQGGSSGSSDVVRNVLYWLVIPMVFAAGMAGQLLIRIPYRPLVASGLAIASVGALGLTFVTASTPTWSFAYGYLPVGGLILPLIPLGFGVGLTFAPTVLAVQYQVEPKDVGAATSLVTFMQSLGASLGIALLTTVQQTLFRNLSPSPPSPICVYRPNPPPFCFPYLQGVQNALVVSFDDVFKVMLILLLVAFGFSLLLSGRIPRRVRPSPAASPPG